MVRKVLTVLVCTLICWQSSAQVAAIPSTKQMIEQLTAPPNGSPRNLFVEEVAMPTDSPSSAAPVPTRPSLSLLIQFDFNSATVRGESHPALVNLSKALQSARLSGSRFAIEGHTDAKGTADYNLKLSQQRAQAVCEFLQAQGVMESRLQASGKGASELANGTQPFAAINRRVRIVNLD